MCVLAPPAFRVNAHVVGERIKRPSLRRRIEANIIGCVCCKQCVPLIPGNIWTLGINDKAPRFPDRLCIRVDDETSAPVVHCGVIQRAWRPLQQRSTDRFSVCLERRRVKRVHRIDLHLYRKVFSEIGLPHQVHTKRRRRCIDGMLINGGDEFYTRVKNDLFAGGLVVGKHLLVVLIFGIDSDAELIRTHSFIVDIERKRFDTLYSESRHPALFGVGGSVGACPGQRNGHTIVRYKPSIAQAHLNV